MATSASASTPTESGQLGPTGPTTGDVVRVGVDVDGLTSDQAV
jgi:hypothetical protein